MLFLKASISKTLLKQAAIMEKCVASFNLNFIIILGTANNKMKGYLSWTALHLDGMDSKPCLMFNLTRLKMFRICIYMKTINKLLEYTNLTCLTLNNIGI